MVLRPNPVSGPFYRFLKVRKNRFLVRIKSGKIRIFLEICAWTLIMFIFWDKFFFSEDSTNLEQPYLKNIISENWFFICFRTLRPKKNLLFLRRGLDVINEEKPWFLSFSNQLNDIQKYFFCHLFLPELKKYELQKTENFFFIDFSTLFIFLEIMATSERRRGSACSH